MLPDIISSKDGGIGVLNRLGVDKSFMNEMYKKYAPYASKIPGLNKGVVDNTLSAIEKAMDSGGARSAAPARQSKPIGFDSSKYPRI